MNTFEEQMQTFWMEVQEIYNNIDRKNYTYYMFQTDYRENPDLMIVGINPGGETNGNPNPILEHCEDYNNYTDGDSLWCSRIRELFDFGNDEYLSNILRNCVGTNRCYINTPNKDILEEIYKSNSEKIFDSIHSNKLIPFKNKAGELLFTLIDIIKPKHILTLGSDVFSHLVGAKHVNTIGSCEMKIGYPKCGNSKIPVGYIPNPSGINNKYFSATKMKEWPKTITEFMNL